MHRRSFLIASLAGGLASAATAAPAGPRILAYGDSNTWGWRPVRDGEAIDRHADDVRWPGVVQGALGGAARVAVNGLWGRTLCTDLRGGIAGLSGEDHNGLRRLPFALLTENPVHFMVVMLGTNDMMGRLDRSPEQVSAGVADYAAAAAKLTARHPQVAGPRLLLVAPPPLGDVARGMFADDFDEAAVRKSRELGSRLQEAASKVGVAFLDAGRVVSTDGLDGVHLTAEAHRRLGTGIARALRPLLGLEAVPR